MRWMPSGSFQMGSPENEAERKEDEILHPVTLTQGYWLADTACTQNLWLAVMGENPSDFTDDLNNPVNRVSWNDCQQFFEKANERLPDDFKLRFPTEAEWEYACRANTQTVFSWGDRLSTEQANYDGNNPYHKGKKGEYRKRVVDVLQFQVNPWGLYQMHGNVWEWCSDWLGEYAIDDNVDPQGVSEGQSRVLRGGSWISYGRYLRSANRYANGPVFRNFNVGFRLAGG